MLFLFGLLIGSFLNVLIYRLPRGESIIYPPSHCPFCGERLKTIDLIPVLSYIMYKGRCRYCGEKISWRYPFVELLTAFLFFLLYLKFGFSSELYKFLILISFLIVCSFIDLDYKIIPNKITYTGIIIGLIFSYFSETMTLFNSLMGIILPASFMIIIALIFKNGLGMGDIKLIAMIGAFAGAEIAFIGLFFGAFIGSIISLLLMATKKMDRHYKIPFGPYISLGTIIMIFYGNKLIGWYINLF